jgi:hypothetical protein
MSAVGDLEGEVRRTLEEGRFAAAHPTAARTLDAAFALLWSGKTDDADVTRLGDLLRDALLVTINDVIGDPPRAGADHPILRLREFLDSRDLVAREAQVLRAVVELARVALRADFRLSSLHDERAQGQPEPQWDELRRAAFATAFACYELDRLTTRS